MSITTKNGDGGMTNLIKSKNVAKSDERIALLGSIDELTSHLGLVKAQTKFPEAAKMLDGIQGTLIAVMAGIAEPHSLKHRLSEDAVKQLEDGMERMQQQFKMPENWVLPGKSERSAQIDIARTVARRCERALSSVTIKYGSDKRTKQFLNRLSDYLFVLARFSDALGAESRAVSRSDKMENLENIGDTVMQEVLKRIARPDKITLENAKKLIDKVEDYVRSKGMQAVLAVSGPDGNPIAVHVMDGAFLVSFDVAVKKAYTSAAVKMSTMELGKLIQPGGTFQGLDRIQGDKMVFFGGGVPLMAGEKLIGALGVSGGTGEEDHDIAEYGLKVFDVM